MAPAERRSVRPLSAPASPRLKSPARATAAEIIASGAPLTKAEYARLAVESHNLQASRSYREAAAARRNWHVQQECELRQHRMSNVLFTKESVREGMRRSVEQVREQASQGVTAQRANHLEIAARRADIRTAHASYGKQLHDRQYGANAAARRSLSQAAKVEERRELGAKGAVLAAERNHEAAAGAAARVASVERVRQLSGSHVTRNALSEEMSTRQEAARIKRERSAEYQSLIQMRQASQLEEAEETRQRILALEANARENKLMELNRKKTGAQVVRSANQVVNSVAHEVRLESARRRKLVHDTVVAAKSTDAPLPELSAGWGGVAGSRRATAAAAFAARLPTPPLSAESRKLNKGGNEQATTKHSFSYIFEPGPTGLTLDETHAGVIVGEVAAGSAAEALSVPIGGVVLAVNALSVFGLSRIGVHKAISRANWPMTLVITPCFEYRFEEVDVKRGTALPLGLTVKDTQNGVVITDVIAESAAAREGLPIGSLLVAVNGLSAACLCKADVGPKLKERPLCVQVVPREAACLFRPRGPYRTQSRGW